MAEIPTIAKLVEPTVSATTIIRQKQLVQLFKERYGSAPQFVARSPGRVNIIGEHIDYCGFSVLPMAIDRDVLIAVAATPNSSETESSVVTLANVEAEKYKETEFTHSVRNKNIIEIDASLHAWSNYFKCGYKGIHEDLALPTPAPHLNVMVSGNVPAGAGLSSSSAFVCASAVAVGKSVNAPLVKQSLTETAIRAERYAGVQTGGMDQSISIMASPSSALLIQFHPTLAASPVEIPSITRPYKFVVANSLVTADKHVTAARNYNLRVVETRVAATLLGAWISGGFQNGTAPFKGLQTLRQVVDLYVAQQKLGLGGGSNGVGTEGVAFIEALKNLEALSAIVFDGKAYSCNDTVAALQKHFGTTFGSWADVEKVFCKGINSVYLDDGLQLQKRVRHVFSEARRVMEFTQVCALNAPFYRGSDVLTDLGALMNASQESCAKDFNCSCPELDELTALCRESGAVGSRLTGAGWGGCTVSLVPAELVESFIQKVTDKYYAKRHSNLDKIGDWIFATTPGVGAVVFSQ
ncbi:ribosomal protein S5 domain 2-type protein [Obelidium mucronatum]|nr:ribosomal protein S5 domain 2-type protein [Obelidium mucronatum]